jgi:methylase of polypeptide subunit release factors
LSAARGEAADPRDAALLSLLGRLDAGGYDFVSPTPSTHALVRKRRMAEDAHALRDVFGWNRPFRAEQLAPELFDLMHQADMLEAEEDAWTSRLRASRLDGRLYWHSAVSTQKDAVFLGPDSYRYVRFIDDILADGRPVGRAVDIGVGAGAGALAVAARRPQAEVLGSDINPEALRLARINAAHAGLRLDPVESPGVPADGPAFDLIIANPPFIAGDSGATYRDGGDLHGAAVALAWTEAALKRLTPGGRLLLYTGAPIVDGHDVVRERLAEQTRGAGGQLFYEEIDPDIFGRTLRRPDYATVERIAAVGAVVSL